MSSRPEGTDSRWHSKQLTLHSTPRRNIQRALDEEAWPGPVTLRVRMALHTGEANERAGDYFGPPLNRAARLMSAAHGGQILCSEVTARLLRDRPLRDLGVVALRDLSEPERCLSADDRRIAG